MGSIHLVVLVHGLWGNSSHMNYIRTQIEEVIAPQSADKIVVYTTGSHSGFLTYDGIDVNGKRICDEILAETDRLQAEKDKITKFSVVGYSLGGLISRYAMGYLKSVGYFEQIEPVNFTTFCTPHVGVLNPGNSWATRLFNFCTPYLLAHTGPQLFLKDGKKDRLPLLLWMSDPSSVFFKALASFKNVALYANIINDKRTSWYTAAISARDPFNSMINENSSAYILEFIKGYAPNVIDISKPIQFKSELNDRVEGLSIERGQRSLLRKLRWVKVIFSAVFITPVWVLYLLVVTIVERIKNSRRVGKFFRDTSNSLIHLYEGSAIQETVEGHTSAVQLGPDSHEDEDDDILAKVQDETDTLVESVFTAMNSDSYKNYHDTTTKDPNDTEKLDLVNMKGVTQDFNLNLNKDQVTLIDNLNKLNWKKFPVLIRNTKQTHRAAIYRIDDPSFAEGKTVVKHFVTEVFEP